MLKRARSWCGLYVKSLTSSAVAPALVKATSCRLVYIIVGLTRGEFVEYCGDTYAEYIASPAMIATGFAAFLVSSLLFQVVTLFAVHVEKSHAGR